SLVRLFRLQRRALLWTASGHPLLRWRTICVPPVLWLGLRKPTADGAASPLGPSAEDQDETGRRRRLACAVPSKTKGDAPAHISAAAGPRGSGNVRLQSLSSLIAQADLA